MLKELKFVQGAISQKDLLPIMTHFIIENGTVRGYNGTIALSSPIQFDINCKPKATPLVNAITKCKETISLSMTGAGKISIKSGAFLALVECTTDAMPIVEPDGDMFTIDGDQILKAFKALAPFIATDASRPWSNGILLHAGSAFATNNVIGIEYWLGWNCPVTINIPRMAIKEMIRINEAPVAAQATNNSITFHYSDGRWLRSQLLDLGWPDITKILNVVNNPIPVDPKIFEALENIKPFVEKNGAFSFVPGAIKSHRTDLEGATFEIPGLNFQGVYNIEMFSLLEGIATHIDLSFYPKAGLFFGENIRGAIAGLHQ